MDYFIIEVSEQEIKREKEKARALRATDRARAIELARAAQADFEGLDRGGAIELVDVKAWLASAH